MRRQPGNQSNKVLCSINRLCLLLYHTRRDITTWQFALTSISEYIGYASDFNTPYDGPFRVVSRWTKTFRIQRGIHEKVVTVDRFKAAVSDKPPDKPCGTLSLLLLPHTLSLRPAYFLFLEVCIPRLQLPPYQPAALKLQATRTLLLCPLHIIC
ncbi:unnamed protein product [Schistocephalus solidus]|uniref:FERM domain-containing protein n=1 Tax=Schistocephalus solidus TaxID=70667 RepID=A0A183T291_SCHSO|nr:unnamed protein product [Schistocephalus solidus]